MDLTGKPAYTFRLRTPGRINSEHGYRFIAEADYAQGGYGGPVKNIEEAVATFVDSVRSWKEDHDWLPNPTKANLHLTSCAPALTKERLLAAFSAANVVMSYKHGISTNGKLHIIKAIHGKKNPDDIEFRCGLRKHGGPEYVLTTIPEKNLAPYSLCSSCFPEPSSKPPSPLRAMTGAYLNKDVSKQLSESLKSVGELQPILVCKQHPEKVLLGRHRKAVGFTRTEEFDVQKYADVNGIPHEVAEEVIIRHGNIQRPITGAERKAEFAKLADLVHRQLDVPKRDVAARIASFRLFPSTTVRRYVGPEFKQEEKAKAGKASGEARSVPTWEQTQKLTRPSTILDKLEQTEPPVSRKQTAEEVFDDIIRHPGQAPKQPQATYISYDFDVAGKTVRVAIDSRFSVPKWAIRVELP